MATYVELPLGADLLQDRAGNLQVGATATVVLRDTSTPATHAKTDGTTATTGGLRVRSDSRIGSATEPRYFPAGVPVDVTIAGRTRRVEPVAASPGAVSSFVGGSLFSGTTRLDAAAAQTLPLNDNAIYIDTADFGAVTTLLRLSLRVLVNSTAPAANIVAALCAVSAPTGTAGVLSLTQGTTVSGSTATVTTPAANSSTRTTVSFAIPATGWYAVILTVSANMAAASSIFVGVNLGYREGV